MKILVADDDPISQRMLQGILVSWGYEVITVNDGDNAWKVLQAEDAPSMAILDWIMPGKDGKSICQAVRKLRKERYYYLVLVTSKSQKADIIQGLEAGADDYLSKPYDPLELKARLITGRRILDLQEQLISTREALRYQATRDPLTQVWNHRAMMELFDKEIERAQRQKSPLGLLIADLDHFKKVNDTYGHLAGDAVLCEATKRFTNALRPYDLLGRYGGEEFIILLPNCDFAKSYSVAERVRLAISSKPVLYQNKEISISSSFGGTIYGAQSATEPHALILEADTALYQAKNEGRNRVVFLKQH